MLIFRLANATECGAKTHADAMLRLLPRIRDAGVIKGKSCRGYGKLRIPIEPLQPLWRKKLLRVPVQNFASASHLERLWVKAGNTADPGLRGENRIPKFFAPMTDAGDGTDSSDDGAPFHTVILFVCASTYAFIQCKVLLATFRMKKSPTIGSTIGASAG